MREFELKPSRRLGLFVFGMTALALAAIGAAALPAEVRLALGLAVIVLAVQGWRRARFREIVRVAADGQLQFLGEQGDWREVEVLGDSFVSTGLIILRYREGGRRVRTLTLLSDSADADGLRRLRVSLLWAGRTRSDTASRGAG